MNYGCKKERKDRRDYKLATMTSNLYADQYKIKIPRVKNQGSINSCVAFALSTFLEECYKDENLKFSTGFIYGYRPDDYNQGQGMYPREAIKTLKNVGDVLEKDFNYNKEMIEIKNLVNDNLDKLIALADEFKIESYARIYNENEIKNCLIQDTLVPISIPVRGSLELDENNIIQITDKEITGYHMLIIYGWNESGYLIQNSWGEDWGDSGCAILPYEYEIDSAWAISTYINNILTHQTLWQKIISFIKKIIDKIKNLFNIK